MIFAHCQVLHFRLLDQSTSLLKFWPKPNLGNANFLEAPLPHANAAATIAKFRINLAKILSPAASPYQEGFAHKLIILSGRRATSAACHWALIAFPLLHNSAPRPCTQFQSHQIFIQCPWDQICIQIQNDQISYSQREANRFQNLFSYYYTPEQEIQKNQEYSQNSPKNQNKSKVFLKIWGFINNLKCPHVSIIFSNKKKIPPLNKFF